MASKENQMSLDIIAKALPFEPYICYIHTLQKAIDDLELKDKALDKACNVLRILNNEKNNLRLKKLYLRQAKKELESDKQ